MLPVGPLMKEHRVIEKMIAIIASETKRIETTQTIDTTFIMTAVDFIQWYADRLHHGKEEDILFRDLAQKPLKPEHANTVKELIEEHGYGRKLTQALITARGAYQKGTLEALKEITTIMRNLVEFYPRHIEKEDKHLFLQCMAYFTCEEQDAMLEEFWRFDREIMHIKYKKVVSDLQSRSPFTITKTRA